MKSRKAKPASAGEAPSEKAAIHGASFPWSVVAQPPKPSTVAESAEPPDADLDESNEFSSPSSDPEIAASGVATLRQLASADDASSDVLFRVTSVMLTVLPVQLRDTRLTVYYAERLAALSHYTDPTSLLLLAQAYLANGQREKATDTAKEGLALLPPHLPGTQTVRCRLLLEHILSRAPSKGSAGST
jgi:hypothetical protein